MQVLAKSKTEKIFYVLSRTVSYTSNINEVIRSVLNSLSFFFHDKILQAQKAQKEYKPPKSTKKH